MVEARGFVALCAGVVGTSVFCFFGEEVEEDFVVGEEGGLGIFDLVVCEFEYEGTVECPDVVWIMNDDSFWCLTE